MGLKDDLIAKAKNSSPATTMPGVDIVEDSFAFADSESSVEDIDFSKIEEDIGLVGEDSFSSDSYDEEPEIVNEPNFSQQFIDPVTQQPFVEEEEYQPVQQEEVVVPTQQFEEPKNSFRDYHEHHDYYSSSNHHDDSGVMSELLTLAKRTILKDISDNFESSIFTKESLQNLIASYSSSKQSNYSNFNALFASLLDEVMDSKYVHEYYQDMTNSVINSIKSDINF